LALTLTELEPYYAKAETKWVSLAPKTSPGSRQQQLKVMYNGATRVGYKTVHTAGWRLKSASRRARQAAGCWDFVFRDVSPARSGRRYIPKSPKLKPRANSTSGLSRWSCKSQHDANGKTTGVLYADKDGNINCRRLAWFALPELNRDSAPAPKLCVVDIPNGLANSSGQVGRTTCAYDGSVFGVFKKPVHFYRGTVMAGIIRMKRY